MQKTLLLRKRLSIKIALILTVVFCAFVACMAVIFLTTDPAKLEKSPHTIWMAALLLIFSLTSITFFTLEKYISQPLREMLDHMKNVESASYKTQLENAYTHEIEAIADSFRSAIHEISLRDKDLKEYTENLEALVSSRTAQLEQERMHSLNSAKLASLGEVSSGVAHEINNPLAVIEGKVYLLKEQLEKSNAPTAQLSHLNKISEMVERISNIIASLRYFSKDTSQDTITDFSLKSVVNEVKTLCLSRIHERGIRMNIHLPEECIPLRGCGVQLSQVLLHLIQNAMDAVHGSANPEITVDIRKSKSSCKISVIDNGPGVPEHLKDKIFQPFFTTKGVGKGTGLGLSISYGIIEQHGGILSLSREQGQTKFEFSLPIHKASNAETAA